MISQSSHKSGRKAIPVRWTRVIKIDEMNSSNMDVFSIDEDMNHQYDEPSFLNRKKNKIQWNPLFDPREWWENTDD